MSGFRKLVEISDKACREELENYYVVSESRMNNMLYCLEQGADQIQKLHVEKAKLIEVLDELQDLMQGVIDGDYEPDSFTLQPARQILTKHRTP